MTQLEPTGDADYDELQRRLGLQPEKSDDDVEAEDVPPHDPPADDDNPETEEQEEDVPDPEPSADPDSDES